MRSRSDDLSESLYATDWNSLLSPLVAVTKRCTFEIILNLSEENLKSHIMQQILYFLQSSSFYCINVICFILLKDAYPLKKPKYLYYLQYVLYRHKTIVTEVTTYIRAENATLFYKFLTQTFTCSNIYLGYYLFSK